MANSVYQEPPETPCMFKPIGISRHQDVAKNLVAGEMLKLADEEGVIGIYNLAFQKIGEVPAYLEAMLRPHIEASPDGYFYAKVKQLMGKRTIGAWCTLLESPSLPEFLSTGRTDMSVWYGKVKGVSYEGRQEWLEKIEDMALSEGSYPHLVLQKDDGNPMDSNALKILAYFTMEGWKQIGYVDRDDAKEMRMASQAKMLFYTRLISVGKSKQGDNFGGIYEVVGMAGPAEGFEALA